ncbi:MULTISPECIES: DUF4177 domain-containing protein [Thioclava]|uniref:DUF4177 domain-containing protein n=1 Tax=Thioclava kandeliae TaxID=3070818 RepID=A0ABV1SC62_9RHOB
MQEYEYKVIPAPVRGERDRGMKTPEDRFANTLTATLNAMAVDGWDYLRAETLPAEERSGLRGKATVYHNMLVFRRAKPAAAPKAPASSEETQAAKPAAKAPLVAEPRSMSSVSDGIRQEAPRAEPVLAPRKSPDPMLDPANQGDPSGSPQPLRIPSAIERRARALSAKVQEGTTPKLGAATPGTSG